MTSGDARTRLLIRAGILRTGKAPSSDTWRDSSTRSLVAVAQQVSTMPAASSAALSALSWWLPWTTVPAIFLHLQEPQAPSLQP